MVYKVKLYMGVDHYDDRLLYLLGFRFYVGIRDKGEPDDKMLPISSCVNSVPHDTLEEAVEGMKKFVANSPL
jgi:hypothetical protein